MRRSAVLAAAALAIALLGAGSWPYQTIVSTAGNTFAILANGAGETAQNSSGATAPVACDKSVAVNLTATAQLIAASGSTAIYVCGFHATTAGTSPTLQFEYGTGAVCATGTTVLTGTYAPTSGTVLADGGTLGTILRTPAAQALCAVVSGTTPSIQGVLTYAQF